MLDLSLSVRSLPVIWPRALIAQLFAGGTKGFAAGLSVTEAFNRGWLFQDSAGTTAAAIESPVGLALDQSGGSNHASQSTSTKRPTLKDDGSGHLYLLFDGVDDCLATHSIDLSATDKATVFAGVRKLSSSAAIMWELSNNTNTNAGSLFGVCGIDQVLDNYEAKSVGSSFGGSSLLLAKTSAYPAPHSAVITTTHNIFGDLSTINVNGVDGASSRADQGNGNFGNYPFNIGARFGAAAPLSGRMYTLPIIVGRAVEPALIAQIRASINASMGGIY